MKLVRYNSLLDHCIITDFGNRSISKISVLYDFLWSDHKPIMINIENEGIPDLHKLNSQKFLSIDWSNLKYEDIDHYNSEIYKAFREKRIHKSVITCSTIKCNSLKCRNVIDKFYTDIVHIPQTSVNATLSKYSGK